MGQPTIAIVDDDENLRFVVKTYLEGENYTVHEAASARSFLDVLQNHQPDVVLVDLSLPDEDGLTLISKVRNSTDAALIVVSGRTETTDRVVGLEMGADDYITKPFEMRELLARIKAVQRRRVPEAKPLSSASQMSKMPIVKFDNWTLNKESYQLIHDKEGPIEITTGEFELLNALVSAPNRALSREQLYSLTRNQNYESFDRAVDIQIARLRKKLGDDPQIPRIIKTVRGIGYMFISKVSEA